MTGFSLHLEDKNTEIIIDSSHNFKLLKPEADNYLLVTDTTMAESSAARGLISLGIETVILGSGEKYKNIESITAIAEAGVKKGLDRGSVIIGLGGGVICDMAAFAASVYMRGCRLVLVPTSLLAMVDASIGGKCGVDFLNKKNLLGSFYPAETVLVFTEFLKTLSEKEYKSGLAEIIKHCFLSGGQMLKFLEQHRQSILRREPEIMEELIYQSLRFKAEYVEKDFREEGIRAHLNLGHTFGHALETAAGLGSITHGEAVAWGVIRAMRAGVSCGLTDSDYALRVEKILRDYDYDIDFDQFDRSLYFDALNSDKKKKNGRLRFILQKNIGETVIETLDADTIMGVV